MVFFFKKKQLNLTEGGGNNSTQEELNNSTVRRKQFNLTATCSACALKTKTIAGEKQLNLTVGEGKEKELSTNPVNNSDELLSRCRRVLLSGGTSVNIPPDLAMFMCLNLAGENN
ncbi:hypothetical protein NPIL_292761 [Nephila pilipes]|uniref:Uncharacterized protein n=1 Tax=Nephila pilipes TaxID=299642 RepID=A0A8X6MC49_NEPPI|nr:hypothetical protein NPIL_292761 [Nephila pilipes]